MPVARPYKLERAARGRADPGGLRQDRRDGRDRLLRMGRVSRALARRRTATARCILGWTGDNGDPDNFLATLLGCDAVGGNNRAQWCNEEFDKLVKKAKTVTDQAERTKLYEEAQVVFKREAPWATHRPFAGRHADEQEGHRLRDGPARHPSLRRRRHRRVAARLNGASRHGALRGRIRLGRAGSSRGPAMLRFILGRVAGPDPDLHRHLHHRLRLHPAAARRPGHAHGGRAGDGPGALRRDHARSSATTGRSSVQYLDYLGGLADRRFRHLHRRPSGRCCRSSSRSFRRRSSSRSAPSLFAVILGIPAGIFAAVKRGSFFDQAIMGVGARRLFHADLLVGPAAHHPLLRHAGWTPVSGRISLLYFFPPVTGFMLIDSLLSGQPGAFRSALSHLILPTIVLGTIPLAVIARQTRSAMLEVLGEDYVRTARAKGLPPQPRHRPARAPQRADPGRSRRSACRSAC